MQNPLNFISNQCSSEHKLPFLRQDSLQVIILMHVFAHLSREIKSLSKICRSPKGRGSLRLGRLKLFRLVCSSLGVRKTMSAKHFKRF